MEQEIKAYRLRFNRTLEPIKVMLVNKKLELAPPEWLHFVQHTRERIIHHPDQYLGSELPNRDAMITIIDRIFEDFLENQN